MVFTGKKWLFAEKKRFNVTFTTVSASYSQQYTLQGYK
nr:hypothetical protein [Mucilaginibacter sp. X4EP1]